MLNRVPITFKMLALVSGAILVTTLVFGVVANQRASDALHALEEQNLDGLAESRAVAMEDYLATIEQDLKTVATNPETLMALQSFEAGWNDFGSQQTDQLQHLYITANPNELGEKHLLDYATDGSSYSAAHEAHHPWFRQFLEARGYYDIFLFSLDGDLVYTVFKELDYATNLRDGQYKDTDLGNAFRVAADTLTVGETAIFDFKPYAPSHGAPAAFMSTPILDETGAKAGVLVFQMPIDRLNAIMGSTIGLGETGDSFVVGSDGLMRTDAPQATQSTILKEQIDPEQFSGVNSDNGFSWSGPGYRGETVLSATRQVHFPGI